MSVNNLLSDPGVKGWANLYVNNLETYNDLTVNGKITVDGRDMTPDEIFINYAPEDPTRFSGVYSAARLRIKRFGDIVIANVDFTNDPAYVQTQNGNAPINFIPTDTVPDEYKPGVTHEFSMNYAIHDSNGDYLYYTPGTITIFTDLKITIRISRIDTGVLKINSVEDGLRFRTVYTPITYFKG